MDKSNVAFDFVLSVIFHGSVVHIKIMVTTDTRFGLWQTRVKDFLAQQIYLNGLQDVKPSKMEISCDG